MDRVLKGQQISLEILSPTSEYAQKISRLIYLNREYLDLWRGDVLRFETEESSLYKLFMDNYYYEKNEGYFYHILKDTEIIGHLGAVSSGKFWELSYWLDKDCQGKGYMTDALQTFERAWFEHSSDPLTIFVHPNNEASLRVVRKMGYIPFGQNRYLKNFAMFMMERNDRHITSHSSVCDYVSTNCIVR